MTLNKNKIINSQILKEETEHEFGKSIIESNGGSTRYSSRDKSYSNLFEFFFKVGKKESDGGKTRWGRLSTKEKILSAFKAVVVLSVIIAFVAFASHVGGKIGVIISIGIVFTGWMLISRITSSGHKKE